MFISRSFLADELEITAFVCFNNHKIYSIVPRCERPGDSFVDGRVAELLRKLGSGVSEAMGHPVSILLGSNDIASTWIAKKDAG